MREQEMPRHVIQDSVLDKILEGIRALQNRMSRIETIILDDPKCSNNSVSLEVTFERTQFDVRNYRNSAAAYIKLKEAT